MRELLIFTVSGLATGAIYAITASGLTLTYVTTGIFNFAHGATAMIAAFCYWQMRVDWGWPAPIALTICVLVLAPLFGLLLQMTIMRRLEDASELVRAVATVALMLGLLSLAILIWNPNTFRSMRPFYAGEVFEIADVRVPYHDAIVLGVALLVAILLRVLLYRTRVGIAMRATVDDRSLASLNGARPQRVASAAWVISTSLAALAGVLVAPRLSLAPLPITLLIVNAYAAAIVGRLRSLPMTFVGALALGLANDFGINYLAKLDPPLLNYFQAFTGVIPVFVLFIALLVVPRPGFPMRRPRVEAELAPVPTWAGTALFGVCLIAGTAMVSAWVAPGDLFSTAKMWGVAIVALSMVPLVGYAGRLSLCQLTFAGIGAAVVGQIGPSGNPISLIWAALITGLVGALVALPALRLSGIYLALATAAFAVAMDRWLFTLPSFRVFDHEIALFPDQSLDVSRFDLLISLQSSRSHMIFGAVVFVLLAFVVVRIRRGVFGRRLLAMNASPTACVTLGMDLRTETLTVFAVSAAMAGIGGGIYAAGLQSPASNQFELLAGLPILLLMFVTGIQSIGAAVAVGVVLGTPLIPNVFGEYQEIASILIAVAAVGVGRHPNGFIVARLRPRWAVVPAAPRVLAGFGIALAGVLALRIHETINSWTWAIATLALLQLLPLVAAVRVKRRRTAASELEPLTPASETPVASSSP